MAAWSFREAHTLQHRLHLPRGFLWDWFSHFAYPKGVAIDYSDKAFEQSVFPSFCKHGCHGWILASEPLNGYVLSLFIG